MSLIESIRARFGKSIGGAAADALRYLVATKSNKVYVRKLVGL